MSLSFSKNVHEMLGILMNLKEGILVRITIQSLRIHLTFMTFNLGKDNYQQVFIFMYKTYVYVIYNNPTISNK